MAATALGLTLTLAAALAACTPEDPIVQPTGSSSSTPVFASEEEALAAAEELYGEYLAASNESGLAGWNDISVIEPFVRGQALEDERDSAADFASKGYQQVGSITFDSAVLQQVDDSGPGTVEITIYLCLDVSQSDIVDGSGNSIVDSNRLERFPLEVGFDDQEQTLKINRSDAWSGENFC